MGKRAEKHKNPRIANKLFFGSLKPLPNIYIAFVETFAPTCQFWVQGTVLDQSVHYDKQRNNEYIHR